MTPTQSHSSSPAPAHGASHVAHAHAHAHAPDVFVPPVVRAAATADSLATKSHLHLAQEQQEQQHLLQQQLMQQQQQMLLAAAASPALTSVFSRPSAFPALVPSLAAVPTDTAGKGAQQDAHESPPEQGSDVPEHGRG